MPWHLPREQGRRLAAAAALAGLAFAVQGPFSTSATLTGSASVQSSQFSTSSWCVTNIYPATVLGTVPAPRDYLRLDETGAPPATIVDSAPGSPVTGRSGTGATWGQPGLLDCVSNTALQLNGAAGQPRIWAGPVVASPGPTAFTITAWVNVTSGQGRLVGFGRVTALNAQSNNNNDDRMLYVDSAGRLRFGVFTDAGVRNWIQSPTAIIGARHHVAATFDTTGMKLYVDGALVAQNATVTTARSYRGQWRVGYDNLPVAWGVTTANSMPVATVDEVAIWGSALNATQVLILATSNDWS